MKKLWFKAKNYGYGWYPCSWEGGIVTLIYVLFLIGLFGFSDLDSYSGRDAILKIFVPVIIVTSVLVVICFKTGERPRWRWGDA